MQSEIHSMTGGKQLVSIRFLDQFKLYEDQSGMMSYAERAIRKAVNVFERIYCNRLNPSAFEGKKSSWMIQLLCL